MYTTLRIYVKHFYCTLLLITALLKGTLNLVLVLYLNTKIVALINYGIIQSINNKSLVVSQFEIIMSINNNNIERKRTTVSSVPIILYGTPTV